MVKESLPRDLFRLYQLIWKRFVASRMQPAVYETISARINAGEYLFTAASSRLAFDGFMSVYTDPDEEKKEKNAAVRSLEAGTELALEKMDPQQHFTQPPAHYTEASLVKTLEELGIGRPSTYAPTITTIINRRYVAKENKNLYMTELGEVVNNMMKEAFPSIVDVNFTATMEALLDRVGDGSVPWKTVVENFWPDLYEAVTEAEKNLEEVKVEDEVTDVICENCGRNMVVKYGPHGKFLACPGFPDCKNTKPYLEKIGVPCPKCGKEVILRKTKKGRKYYGCENNPECDFMSWQKPSADASADENSVPEQRSFSRLIRVPGVKEVLTCFFCYCAVESTAGMWAASYCTLFRGIDAKRAASWASLFYVGITIGRFFCGFITMKLNDQKMIRLGQAVIAVGTILMLLPLGDSLLFIGLILIGLGCAPIYPSIIHETPANFGADLSQGIIGIQMAFAYVGTCLMPPVFGVLGQHISFGLYPVFLMAILILMVVMAERMHRVTAEKRNSYKANY